MIRCISTPNSSFHDHLTFEFEEQQIQEPPPPPFLEVFIDNPREYYSLSALELEASLIPDSEGSDKPIVPHLFEKSQ